LALFLVVMVCPFESTNFPVIVRWQVKPLNPGQRHNSDRQIDARIAVKRHGRPPSVAKMQVTSVGLVLQLQPPPCPQKYLNFLRVQNSSNKQRGILYTFQGDANAQRILFYGWFREKKRNCGSYFPLSFFVYMNILEFIKFPLLYWGSFFRHISIYEIFEEEIR
jgi:hypothetical protein